jgi:capsular polysaccharide transport system permease protein
MKLEKKLRNRLLKLFIIIIPMTLGIIYYAFLAVDRYASTAQIAVVDASASSAMNQQAAGAAIFATAVRQISRQQTIFLYEYLSSPDMLAVLNKKLAWHAHFADQYTDPFYWIGKQVSREDLLKFYERLVTIHVDELTGMLTVEAQGLSPEFAYQTLSTMVSQSQDFINDVSSLLATDQVQFAESELIKARLNYENKRDELVAFQSKNSLLDAEAAAQSRAGLIASLEATLATEQANLKVLLSSLNANSPQVRNQKNRVSAIQKQLDMEKSTLVSSSQDGHLNVIAAEYRKLTVDAEIAEQAYKLSVSALQNATIEAGKSIHSVVTVVKPNLPEDPTYPHKLYNLFTLLVVLLFIYGITRFVIASIEDHRD